MAKSTLSKMSVFSAKIKTTFTIPNTSKLIRKNWTWCKGRWHRLKLNNGKILKRKRRLPLQNTWSSRKICSKSPTWSNSLFYTNMSRNWLVTTSFSEVNAITTFWSCWFMLRLAVGSKNNWQNMQVLLAMVPWIISTEITYGMHLLLSVKAFA